MQHAAPSLVTEELLVELHRISPCDLMIERSVFRILKTDGLKGKIES